MAKKKKITILVSAMCAGAVALGLGIWYYFTNVKTDPVKVYPFVYMGMTEYWGDSRESYGPVTSDNIQTVFLSDTQEVTEILVKQGDTVKKGDLLFVLEAMKMENEILSPVDGKVTFVGTTKGSSVDTGAALCVIE